MAKCPNCGAELKKRGDNVYVCERCNTSITLNAPASSSPRQSASTAEAAKIKDLEARLAALEAEKTENSKSMPKPLLAKDGKIVTFFKKYWVGILAGMLLFIAFLTLMITLVGLRGIYVNVNDSHDFYDFDATSYRASSTDFLTGEDTLEEGKWQIKGNKLVLTIDDELFGKISVDFDFEKLNGYKRIKIDGAEYKRVSLVGLKTTKQKVKVTFDYQTSQYGDVRQNVVKTVSIGKMLKDQIEDPEMENAEFLGWYSEPNGLGKRFDPDDLRWENQTFYANWHVHKFVGSWQSDDDNHWKTCESCNKQIYEKHAWKVTSFDDYGHTLECSVCGKNVSEAHEMSDWTIDVEYKCEDIVTRHKDCSLCDYSQVEDNYYVAHELGEWIEDSAATCTAKAHHHKECANCTFTQEEDYGDLKPHELSEWIIDEEKYTCGDTVTRHKDCANCEYSIVDDKYVVPHTWKEQLTEDKQKECSRCGYKELVYEERDGKIYFGEYPQTQETDNGITATLAQMSGDRPVKGNSGDWTDYKYYIRGSTTEYMWYIDLEYQNARYRGVYFTSYRPYYTTYGSSTGTSNQDDNGYYTNTLYWFKWEPIEWRVLERTDGEAFLMSNVILDSQQYYRTDSGTRSIDGKTVYPNNYKESDIRAWLNGTFYDWAFDELDQGIIKMTLVDNSANTTEFSSNEYASENTNDKVFLLSYKDVLNTSYGFNSSSSNYDTARQLKLTSYAQSQGAYTSTDSSYRGNGWWWLRSPCSSVSGHALRVNDRGDADGDGNVDYTGDGVVPALRITL